MNEIQETIALGRASLGIEFGSTRIKAVLTGPDNAPIAVGAHEWDNQFVDRLWTYSLDAIWDGLRDCYASLARDVERRHGVPLTEVGAMGVSAMMHGYLAFDEAGELLVPFRTWRNTTTGPAAAELTELFGHNIPLRWSIAHLYQAVLNGEPHVPRIAHIATLAAYVHWRLTGELVIGVGDASGIFPIDTGKKTPEPEYDAAMLDRFDALIADRGFGWTIRDVLPKPLAAGEPAGRLTPAGAKLLDPTGTLRPGAPLCPPEGDAGTGMVATNTVARRTGNVSAGTSIFAMIVLERELSRVYPELDLVTTPAGDLVAMVHCNNGASELNSWVGLFGEFATALGSAADPSAWFETLFRASLAGEADCGGLLAYNYLAGETITDLDEGRPLFVRTPDSRFTLANFMRAQLFASLATLRIGMDVLKPEGVEIDRMFAHGGLFKTKGVAQRYLAAAIDTPVSVGEIAGEGGAWGIAVLAAYAHDRGPGQTLDDYLDTRVFAAAEVDTVAPDPGDVAGFEAFLARFAAGLAIERAAVEAA